MDLVLVVTVTASVTVSKQCTIPQCEGCVRCIADITVDTDDLILYGERCANNNE